MKIKMRGTLVGVEQVKKSAKSDSLFSMPEDSNAVGRVKYLGDKLGETDLKVGDKVYYGDKRQPVTIDGAEILVMDQENIVAIAEEDVREETDAA